jgi:hypothetical protein
MFKNIREPAVNGKLEWRNPWGWGGSGANAHGGKINILNLKLYFMRSTYFKV